MSKENCRMFTYVGIQLPSLFVGLILGTPYLQVKENGVTTLYTVPANSQGAAGAADNSAENISEKAADPPSTDKKKDRPKRHGSLALFCRKVIKLKYLKSL